MSWQSEVLLPGAAQGEVLRLDAPLSFWGGVDPATSEVTLAGHPQRGARLSGRIVVLPELVGSSSSSAVLLELIHRGRAPAALILGAGDAILPIGGLVARQMGWGGPPILALKEPPFVSGDRLNLSEGGRVEIADATEAQR